MKKTFLFVSLICVCFNLFAQSEKLRVGILNGPTCVPAAYLIDKNADYTFEQFADPQALLPKMIKKEIDIGFMPVNVAAKVYNTGNKALICCAVTGLGNIKLITTDSDIKRFTDLKDKTVYVAGQGATPEYMFRFLLDENKLDWSEDGDVVLDFSIPTAQLAAQMISGKIQYAVVPEPFATIAQMKSEKITAALDFQKEYIEITGEKNIYPLSVMVVRKDLAKENKELLDTFLNEYEKAVEWTVANPVEAGNLSETKGLGLAASVVSKAIPVSNYTYIQAKKAVSQIEALLNIFLNCDKISIGGKLPAKDFYYSKND